MCWVLLVGRKVDCRRLFVEFVWEEEGDFSAER